MRQRRGSLGEVQDSKVARIDAFENVRVNPPEPSPKPGDLDYHSCDRRTAGLIVNMGMIPGGWPTSSGRAHNYFIHTHSWDAAMKKLAGTRAGKQFYVAFDTELMMQSGGSAFQYQQCNLVA